MAARPGSVPVTLVLGEEELLAERAVADAVAVAGERLGPGTSVEEVRAGGLPDGFAMGLATASLFGGGRVVVIQEADGLDATARQAVLALAADPAAATAVVLRAAAPGRQAKFFKDVQRHTATVLVPRLRPAERASWLRSEVRRLGRRADEGFTTGSHPSPTDPLGHLQRVGSRGRGVTRGRGSMRAWRLDLVRFR